MLLLAASLAACDDNPDRAWPINLVSTAQVEQLGGKTWQRILAGTPQARDPARREAVTAISRRLLRAAGEDPGAWQVAVFAQPAINAFALPGRYIGVFEGMFRVADTPGRLAAVIGHEIGHVQSRHGQERMNAAVAKQIGLRVLAVALQLGNVAQANEIAALLGAGVEFGLLLPYSRRQELEADRRGLRLMTKAGFDGKEAIALWQRMAAGDARRGPSFLATHPAARDRIRALEVEMGELARGTAASQ